MRLEAENLKIGDIFYKSYGYTAVEKYRVDNEVDDGKARVSPWDENDKEFVYAWSFLMSTWDMRDIFSTEWEAWECLIKEMQRYTKAATENYKKRKMEMVFGGKK